MSRMLAIIAVIGLALSAAFLGGAWALGGDDIFHDPRSLQGLKPLIDLATRKEWHWTGGDTLALDSPITVRYEPQNKTREGKPNVTVTGPAEAMDHIRFGAGRITSDTSRPKADTARLKAVVSGQTIRKFVVNGGENLQLGHVDQDELAIYINGAGRVSGDGRVGDLTLVLSGPGQADLGALDVGDAKVSILGPGRVTLSPHGDLKLFVAGTGRVALLTKPASIKRSIWGNAIIETPDGTEHVTPPVPPRFDREPQQPTPPVEAKQAVPMPMPVPMSIPSGAGPHERVTVAGHRSVDLGHVERERLEVTVAGSGSVTAEGRVDRLEVHVMGQGSADFSRLSARELKVDIAGSGNVVAAPTVEVKAKIVGSGNLRLTTKPPQIERRIIGSGRLIEAP